MNTSSKSGKAADADAPRPEAERLAAEIAALRAELEALVAQVGAVGAAAAGDAAARLKAKAAPHLEAGESVAADLIEDWREIDRKVVTAARENPWRTLGLAALGGLIVGLILRR
jgi:ElaB/YqjD/DUF883 family membrane-anchored ribosome-binding protein